MRLELENLGKDPSFAQSYAPDELPLDERDLRLIEPAGVEGRIRRQGGEVQVSGTLTTTVETPCARCLKPVLIPIKAEFFERFVRAVSWRDEEQHELASEDLNLSVFDGETIDLDELVREEIELATPVQVFCREDCKGLCPACGVDWNLKTCECGTQETDSRWEKLKDLRL
ncbi:MAG: YceD family protein [Acidobacteriota bacterium]